MTTTASPLPHVNYHSAALVGRSAGKPWGLDEAAPFLGLCRATVERAARSNRFRSYKVGRRVFIADEEMRRIASEGF